MRSNLVQITSRITQLAASGRISCARKLFDEMRHRDPVAWNAMISGYSHMGLHQDSLTLFRSMRFSNVNPDHYTFTAALSASAALKDLHHGLKVHALVIVLGYDSSLPVNNSLIDFYGKCESIENAIRVFYEMGLRNEVSWCSMTYAYVNSGYLDDAYAVLYHMPKRTIVSWNTVISGYAKYGAVDICFDLLMKMLEDSCSPDERTLSAVMKACAETSERVYGCMVQGFIIRSGWSSALEVGNAILSFYTKLGEENEILKAVEAVRIFSLVSWNTLIDAHMKLGNVNEACLVFQSMSDKNLISWTSLISGFARNGQGERAIGIFLELKRCDFQPDDVAFGAVLHACSNFSTLGHGKMIHGCVILSGFHTHAYVRNGLVNMYAKGGDLSSSYRVFNDVLHKDLVSWNTMLFAFGLHGCSAQVLQVLEEMASSKIKPDKVTFIGLLMTCSHLGMINKGLSLFESMTSKYGVSPEIEHVACVVDMLCRSGRFEEARKLGDASSLETLLGSHSALGSLATGAELGERLMILKPRDDMSYVLLSNLYCASGKWREAQIVRKTMEEKGVKKTPGCSWIEVRNEVNTFVAGNSMLNPEMQAVVEILESEVRHSDTGHMLCWDG